MNKLIAGICLGLIVIVLPAALSWARDNPQTQGASEEEDAYGAPLGV